MECEEKLSKDVANILNRAAVRSFKMKPDEIEHTFDEAEAACLLLVSSENLKMEVKRRTAEWKMRILCDNDASFDLVNKMHSSILKLGFSNLEIEGIIEIYFAQYCVRQNHTGVAQEILQKLISKLNEALKNNDVEALHYFAGQAKNLLSKIPPVDTKI